MNSLATETLSDIFRLVLAAATPDFWSPDSPSLRTELDRIANAPLLNLSQVCSRWHELALNSPTFWSDVHVNGICGSTETALAKTIGLLSARLEYSRDTLLSVYLTCESSRQSPARALFRMLAQHSHRWVDFCVACSLEGLDTTVLIGRLPSLQKMVLNLPVELKLSISMPPETLKFIDTTPRLNNLLLSPYLLSSKARNAVVSRKQLRSLAFQLMLPWQFQNAISLLPKLPVTTNLSLVINLNREVFHHKFSDPYFRKFPLRFEFPSVTASISSLTCITVNNFHPRHMSFTLEQMFDSLTVPQLRQLILACSTYPQLVLEWPHTQFLALCSRSNLGSCLKTLRIAEVRITPKKLLAVLSALPALEVLEVGDVPQVDMETNRRPLINDHILRALTGGPGQDCLVPRLFYLGCVSRLSFTHNLVVDLVTSRLRDSQGSFHFCLHPLRGVLNPAVHAHLRQLAVESHRRFVYELGPYIQEYYQSEIAPATW
ncbi:hypothetical protein GGX14DRAFT_557716 [Mycena pura]|uniref:F-box domain-containing protein n=1 Tax=Mycena pura TaxID=153505 RepID=A0AAD7E0U7_9AGAR|nr:hypothetical protein GGX14DRAFT_557716 [Mycena pura]